VLTEQKRKDTTERVPDGIAGFMRRHCSDPREADPHPTSFGIECALAGTACRNNRDLATSG
jgi:ribosome maturation protein Sdo1